MGTVTAKRNAERPALGNDSSWRESITLPVEAFDVSISGASPVTVMVSCSWPTSSLMSMVTNCCVATRMPLFSKVLKPVNSALTV